MEKYPVKVLISDSHVKVDNLELTLSIFNQFFELMTSLGVPGVFMGDLFTYRSSQYLDCLLTILQVLTETPFDFDMIPGNHDKNDLTKKESYLDLYSFLPKVKIHDEEYFEYDDEFEIVYCYLGYFKEGVPYLSRLVNLIDMIKADNKIGNYKKVLFTHISINTVRNNDGTLVEGDIELEYFNFFDLTLSGHYHEFQILNKKTIYTRSSHQANFGEDHNKGFTILYSDLSLEYVQSSFPVYKKIYVDASDTEKANKLLKKYNKTKDNIRIIFQGSQTEIEAINPQKFEDTGISVKFENTLETLRDFENIEDAELIRFDKKSLVKYWLEYSDRNNFKPEQKMTGMKLLTTTR